MRVGYPNDGHVLWQQTSGVLAPANGSFCTNCRFRGRQQESRREKRLYTKGTASAVPYQQSRMMALAAEVRFYAARNAELMRSAPTPRAEK
jgi:hypothetical protein